MKNTSIEWTDHTFNPWIGCTKVSPGCANCYAETLMDTRMGRVQWGKGKPRSRTSAANWAEPVKWDRARAMEERDAEACGRDPGPRPRVFCASLADWLDDEVPVEWLADLLDLIRRTPHLDWLLLTKRPENWRARIGLAALNLTERGLPHRLHHWQCGEAPENVWIGTTVEDQTRADERIPALLSIPARVRFLSCEPLLGAVRLGGALYSDYDKAARQDQLLVPAGGFTNTKVNWVIVGGESGPKARPMHPQWARDIRDECEEAGTHFFFKQWGEWAPTISYMPTPREKAGKLEARYIMSLTDHEAVGTTVYHAYPPVVSDAVGKAETMKRVGKHSAGRLLDNREWNEVPKGGES